MLQLVRALAVPIAGCGFTMAVLKALASLPQWSARPEPLGHSPAAGGEWLPRTPGDRLRSSIRSQVVINN